jgi:tetratricopeptide (TPR) repeat protein
VLALADGVGGKVPPEEIAFRKASALAGLGRLDEAVQLVRPFGDGAAMPEWLYRSRLAEVYGTAQRHDEAAAEVEQALRLAPDNATVLMEAAKSEVWHRRNPRRARELLDRARQHALSDVLQPFAAYVEGLIYLEEGRPHEAQSFLGQAYQGASAFRHASPLVGAALDQMHAALALAAAGTGDLPAARRHFRLARPRLEALKQDQVIARCEQALGADDES